MEGAAADLLSPPASPVAAVSTATAADSLHWTYLFAPQDLGPHLEELSTEAAVDDGGSTPGAVEFSQG